MGEGLSASQLGAITCVISNLATLIALDSSSRIGGLLELGNVSTWALMDESRPDLCHEGLKSGDPTGHDNSNEYHRNHGEWISILDQEAKVY